MTLGGAVLSGWRMAGLALDSGAALTSLARAGAGRGGDYRQRIRSAAGDTGAGAVILSLVLPSTEARVSGGRMTIWHGTFTLGNTLAPLDTFLALPGWHKGAAWVNGAHLGRYWPAVGPQLTLYVPAQLLRPPPEVNTLVLLEQVRTSAVKRSIGSTTGCTITEKTSTRAFSWFESGYYRLHIKDTIKTLC